MKDWYSILGVLPSIEHEALRPIYLALVKKYHPDVFRGDSSFAEAKTKDINEAYRILSDRQLRLEFDEELARRGSHKEDFTEDEAFSEDPIDLNELQEAWLVAINHYPQLVSISNNLARISQALNAEFKVRVLITKKFRSASAIASEMKTQFLSSYFGTNASVLDFAEVALICFRRDIALELNKSIKILGDPETKEDARELLSVISSKFDWNASDEKKRPPKERIVFSREWLSAFFDQYELQRGGFFSLYFGADQSTFIGFFTGDGASASVFIVNKMTNPITNMQKKELLAHGFEKWHPLPEGAIAQFVSHFSLSPLDKIGATKAIILAAETLGVSEGGELVAEVDLGEWQGAKPLTLSKRQARDGLPLLLVVLLTIGLIIANSFFRFL